MERTRGNFWVIALVTVLLSVFLGTLAGALAGGLAGYFLGRQEAPSADLQSRLERMEQRLQEMQEGFRQEEGLMRPWGDLSPEWLPPEFPEIPLEGVSGAVVVRVVEDTPAARAGLRRGDVILSVGEEAVGPDRPLPEALTRYRPGDRVVLGILRDGEQIHLEVELGEDPDQPGRAFLGVWVQHMAWPGIQR